VIQAAQAGAVFGWDGSVKNGCSLPTPFLLIFDPRTGAAYGIDLAPCPT
jgi:hypothetical protein